MANKQIETTRLAFGTATTQVGSTITVAPQTGGLGEELVTNGSFTGNADGWTLGAGWTYGEDKVTHTPGDTASLFQGGLDNNKTYTITFDVSGRTAGSVLVNDAVSADGSYTQTFTGSSSVAFATDIDFDGSIDNVSVKEILSVNAVTILADDGEPGLIVNGGAVGGSPATIDTYEGDIVFKPTDNSSGGIAIRYPWGDIDPVPNAYLLVDNITDTRNYNLPDKDGTFAMLDDIPALVLADFADDAAAAIGGVPVNGLYHIAGAVKVRLS